MPGSSPLVQAFRPCLGRSTPYARSNSRRLQRFTGACPELDEGLTIPRHPGRLNRLMLAVTASIRVSTAVFADVAALSPGLRTSPLPVTHAWVGYWRQNARLHSYCSHTTATQVTSCRTMRWSGSTGLETERLLTPSACAADETTIFRWQSIELKVQLVRLTRRVHLSVRLQA